ncbi:Doublecortin domain-containing protein [Trichinella spiralis]|uniref:Doublecortin domain-containing protein n=1 Tax=Trichinella spiralis TaxID=6334 RepID=A0ABR3K901_TRISP
MSSWDGNMCWEWVGDSSDLDQTRVEIVIIWPSISAVWVVISTEMIQHVVGRQSCLDRAAVGKAIDLIG